jgi:hypothetical protein
LFALFNVIPIFKKSNQIRHNSESFRCRFSYTDMEIQGHKYILILVFNATYNSCIVAVSFIGGGNRRNMRKSLGTPRHEHDFKFTTLVVISSCKSYYNEITFTTTLETSEQKKDTVHRCDISEFFIIVYCLHFMLICHQKLIADWYIFKEWLIKTTVVTCILVLCVFVLIKNFKSCQFFI